MSRAPLRVVELFAGVGGFRVALEGYPKKRGSAFEVVWSNQFEPRTKKQHANMVYRKRWPDAEHSEEDIEAVARGDMDGIPEHDLLVGGFPCQDFSIANRGHNRGLSGNKGRLWWSIHRILEKKRPAYILLENVDRLLCSPSKRKGSDFAAILSCLDSLGYAVEWRVVNAASYGFPQGRRRVFILGYQRGTPPHGGIKKTAPATWLTETGIAAMAFPVGKASRPKSGVLPGTIAAALRSPHCGPAFGRAGLMLGGVYSTLSPVPGFGGPKATLGDILLDAGKVPEAYFIPRRDLPKWRYAKGAKEIRRPGRQRGGPYIYREGAMAFPDPLDRPSRTLLTREGGTHASREKHAVLQNGRYRRLCPVELERLNGFPDNFTECGGITGPQRAFFMGNALVVGIVQRLGRELARAAGKGGG